VVSWFRLYSSWREPLSKRRRSANIPLPVSSLCYDPSPRACPASRVETTSKSPARQATPPLITVLHSFFGEHAITLENRVLRHRCLHPRVSDFSAPLILRFLARLCFAGRTRAPCSFEGLLLPPPFLSSMGGHVKRRRRVLENAL